jgi:hypothetical protein
MRIPVRHPTAIATNVIMWHIGGVKRRSLPALAWLALSGMAALARATTYEVGDGKPYTSNWWEWSFKGNITAMTATSDSDGDGVRDRDEYVAGTCPTNPASVFLVDPAGVAGINLTIRWPSASNRTYAVEHSTNLIGMSFNVISNSIAATPPTNSVTGTMHGTTGFYRVRAQVEMGE